MSDAAWTCRTCGQPYPDDAPLFEWATAHHDGCGRCPRCHGGPPCWDCLCTILDFGLPA